MPDPNRERMGQWSRVFVFIVFIVILYGHDAVAIYTGVIGSYDDELYIRAAVTGFVFVLVFRPEYFEKVFDRYMASKGLPGDSKK